MGSCSLEWSQTEVPSNLETHSISSKVNRTEPFAHEYVLARAVSFRTELNNEIERLFFLVFSFPRAVAGITACLSLYFWDCGTEWTLSMSYIVEWITGELGKLLLQNQVDLSMGLSMTTRCLIHWDSLTGQWKPSVTVMMSQTVACLGKLLCSEGCPVPYEECSLN